MEGSPENPSEIRLAVLIDADNISYQNIRGMMEEIARYGNPTIKRIYGDWTRPNLSGWKNILLDYAITPIQQFGYTTGKNATDSAMIIDAMDILYSERADGFCLVSSDSDFTRLATRLREAGMMVYGIGEQKTPNAFIAACDRFIYLEILGETTHDEAETAESAAGAPEQKPAKQQTQTKKKTIKKIGTEVIKLISSTISDLEDENGWAYLGEVGSLLLKKQPSFDSRNYGFEKLTPMIKSMGIYEIDVRETGHSSSKHIYIRIKAKAGAL
ncbi:MAG: NYN domain-containing protein [Clostridiaceae bacterium]|nr:NYN domain-containing protein [Clostridiaceae bacterium]